MAGKTSTFFIIIISVKLDPRSIWSKKNNKISSEKLNIN